MASSESSGFIRSRMDRLRKSLRNSFRRRSGSNGSRSECRADGITTRARGGEASEESGNKPPTWSQDEASVRAGTCSFKVKYLGCVEVYESRGMQVCEEALRVLRSNRRRLVKAVLYVSGDSIRVVDKYSKGLIVDQTIEKVSFCAPDRTHEKGFAYICRDGTTRRWLCYGFYAKHDTGERLSHAVGCAFAVCLEKKQKRDREAQKIFNKTQPLIATATTATVKAPSTGRPSFEDGDNNAKSSFQRNSLRYASLQERLRDHQNAKPAEAPPPKATSNPHAVARPRGNFNLFERQGSLRAPLEVGGAAGKPSSISASNSDDVCFRRFNSLRLNQLPSQLARVAGNTTAFETGSIAEEGSSPSTFNSSSGPTIHQTAVTMDSPSGSSSSPFLPPVPAVTTAQADLNTSQNVQNDPSISARSRGDEWLQTTRSQAKFWQQYRTTSPPIVADAGGAPQHQNADLVEIPATVAVVTQTVSSAPPTFPPPPLPVLAVSNEPINNNNNDDVDCNRPISSNAWTTFEEKVNSYDNSSAQVISGSNTNETSRNILPANRRISATNPFTQESSAIQI